MHIAKSLRRSSAVFAGFCWFGAALAQQPFIYPSNGQSPQQQEADRGQCYSWAVQQSRYDPLNPPPPTAPPPMQAQPQGDQVARGMFGGMLLGAAVGSISGNAGEGAAIGGLFGGIRRAHMQEQQQQQAQQQQMAYAQQQGDIQAQGRSNYQRAFKACMNGRGYTVD